MIALQQLLATSDKDSLEALRTLYQGTFVCAQRLIALNIRATQAIMESNLSGIRAMVSAQGVPAFCAAQSDIAHRLIQQSVGYAVDFNEVIAENQNVLAGLLKAYDVPPVEPSPSDTLTDEVAPPARTIMMLDVVRSMLVAATDSRNTMLEMAHQVDALVTPEADVQP